MAPFLLFGRGESSESQPTIISKVSAKWEDTLFRSILMFVQGHTAVVALMSSHPQAGIAFTEQTTGGFFDILDSDGDGYLTALDVQNDAEACGKGAPWVVTNFQHLLGNSETAGLGMSKAEFLELVRQYWFEPDDSLPGAYLFGHPIQWPGCERVTSLAQRIKIPRPGH